MNYVGMILAKLVNLPIENWKQFHAKGRKIQVELLKQVEVFGHWAKQEKA